MSDLTPAAALRTLVFSNAPAAPAPAQPAPTPATPATPVQPYSPVSPRYAEQWIQVEKENLAAGRITLEEANRRFDALGAMPEQRAPDTRTAEVKLIDKHFPPAKETDFLIRYGEPGRPAPPMTKELQQFDQSVRTWLSGAEFSRDGGNGLVSQIERVAQQNQRMNADELESYGYAEFAKLEKTYGETLDEKLHAAAVMIDAIDKQQPGLKQLLQSRGIGDNALVVAQLIGQSECWHARRKGY